MLLGTGTTDKIQLVTGSAGSVDVLASWVDNASGTISGDSTVSAITTATTTDIVGVPGGSVIRNTKTINVRNKHASNSNTITVQWTDGTTTAELFKVTTGTDLGHIPYNGTSPAVVDIVAGRVSLMFAAAAPSLPLIKDGSLKVLGVSSAERLAEAPDIPPMADAVPGFDVSNWSIILAPAGTPREIVNKLHAELKTVMAAPDVQDQLAKIGMIPIVSPTPEELESFVSSEVTRWGRIVQQAGIAGAH